MEINTVDTNAIFNDLIDIIKPYCKDGSVTEINSNTRFIEDLGVNSARLVDIVIDIEDKFNISIDDESADQIRTIGDAIKVIEAKME